MKLGIDLGGTKIEGIVLDGDGSEVARLRHPTPRGSYSGILDAIKLCVDRLEQEVDASCSIGIGTPGSIDPHTQLARNANSTELNGQPLQADLERLLARPVRLANDANCFALSEATDGAGAAANSLFGIILGTGVGGGVVIGGRLQPGCNLLAGEWGHNPLPWPRQDELPGDDCYCGLVGCQETWLSGPALAKAHNQQFATSLDCAAIVALAAQGDAGAIHSLELYCNRLARGLAQVINLLDPDVIVIGGGLSNVEYLYQRVPQLWERWAFATTITTQLLPPVFGDSSGVRGAAWLWN